MDNYFVAAIKLIKVIKSHSFEAFIVGGYVRDYLLKSSPLDIDITTNALPSDISSMFKKVIPTGIKFEGVTVLYEGYSFEVTTFRKDISYYDHRHPTCAYASCLEEDLSRRDFTINAMALDENLNLIDLYHGLDDLNNKIIRTVGDANIRFYEDALRMLRAFYFASKLNFDIESNTLQGIENNAKYLENISGERIYQELKKMFNSLYLLKGLNYLAKSKILDYLPSLKKATILLTTLDKKVSFIEYLALGFYLEGYSNRYKLSSKESKDIKSIITLIDMDFNNYTLFTNSYSNLTMANNLKEILNKSFLSDLDTRYNNLIIKDKKELDIKAEDIIELGYNGKDIGTILDKLYHLVLDNNVLNNKADIIKYIKGGKING